MIKFSGLTNNQWVSDPIHIKSFFENYVEKLSPDIKALQTCGVDNYNLQTMSSVMGISQTILTTERFHELISYCAEDKLDVPYEPCSMKLRRVTSRHSLFGRSKIPPPNVCDLATLKNIRQMVPPKGKEMMAGKFNKLKYTKSVFINNEPTGKSDLAVKKDTVITIRVHDTIYPNECWRQPVKPVSQEIMVLGSQTLAVLRDKIICPTDYRTSHFETENLIHETEENRQYSGRAKDVFKSGFFFIEDTFYNDLRDPTNIDYSKVIREWAHDKKISPLHTGSMSEMKFENLTVRFGYPYAYQHQGNCEHLIVFSDASLVHEADICEKKRYPLVKSIGVKRPRVCMICQHFHARWITFANERVPVDPFYFCDECFKSYNYKNKEKIGRFQVYEFHPFLSVHSELRTE